MKLMMADFDRPPIATGPRRRNLRRRARRRGLTIAELLISATLLIALVSVIVPLSVRVGRLWQESRTYRLALNELTNQLEDLTLLGDQERQLALANWKPDEQLSHALPDARLTGEVLDDEDGKRLRLSLDWRRQVESQPLSLIGWIHSQED